MFEKFKNWLIYDPKAKQKIAFIVVASLVVGSVLYFIFYLNFILKSPETSQPTTEIPLPEEIKEEKEELVAFDFQENDFQTILQKPIGLPTQVYFVNNDSEIYYFDQELQLSSNKREIDEHTRIAARSFQYTLDGLIINERDQSSLFLESSNSFVKFGQEAISVNFFEQEYYFLNKNEDKVILKKSINALLQKPETIVQFSPQIKDFEAIELRTLNNQLYVFVYEQNSREGNLEIWKIDNRSSQRVQNLNGLVSVNFDQNRFLYTQLRRGEYTTSLIDFSENQQGEVVNLNMKSGLLERKLEGVILADRCSFEKNAENLYCPVKIEKVPSGDPRFADKIILFNYRSQSVFMPYAEFESPVSNLYLDQQKKLYFISKVDGKMYLVKE
jgi:hypothetical protein